MSLALLRLRRLLAGSRRLVVVSIAVAAAQSALLLPIAVLIRDVFDERIPAGDDRAIALAGVIVLALYFASGLLDLLARGLVVGATKQAMARLRHDLLSALYALPQEWHDRQSAGRVHSVVVQDSERVDLMIALVLTRVLPALIVSVALAVVAVVINPLLFAILAVGLPAPIALGLWLGRRYRTRVRAWNDAFERFASQVQRGLRAMSLTKVQGAEQLERERQGRHVEQLAEAGRALTWATAVHSVATGMVAAFAGTLVLVAGGIAVARETITLGDLLSFYAVVALMLRQFQTLFPALPIVITGVESLSRLEWLHGAQEREPYEGTRRLDFRGGLALQDVSFGYGEHEVLHSVELEIAPGDHVALVGPNGAGKSTLARLLLGLYRPQRGRVLADGVALDELDVRALRRSIGVVLQDPVLFRGSVRENIAYARPDASDAEVRAAAERATAAAFIEALPDGYDTQVGEEGVLLSGGQRQRIAIARALLGDPAVLVLDEPTNHLDDAAIARLMANVEALPAAPTVVLVTHDADVAAHGDRVLHLRDGRIALEEAGRRRRVVASG